MAEDPSSQAQDPQAPASAPVGQFQVPPPTPPASGSSTQSPASGITTQQDAPVPQSPDPAPSSEPSSSSSFETEIEDLIRELETTVASAKTRIQSLVETVSSAAELHLRDMKDRTFSLENELSRGGVASRLGAVELALASLAAPQAGMQHDNQGLLQSWLNGIHRVFLRTASQPEDGAPAPVISHQTSSGSSSS